MLSGKLYDLEEVTACRFFRFRLYFFMNGRIFDMSEITDKNRFLKSNLLLKRERLPQARLFLLNLDFPETQPPLQSTLK